MPLVDKNIGNEICFSMYILIKIWIPDENKSWHNLLHRDYLSLKLKYSLNENFFNKNLLPKIVLIFKIFKFLNF